MLCLEFVRRNHRLAVQVQVVVLGFVSGESFHPLSVRSVRLVRFNRFGFAPAICQRLLACLAARRYAEAFWHLCHRWPDLRSSRFETTTKKRCHRTTGSGLPGTHKPSGGSKSTTADDAPLLMMIMMLLLMLSKALFMADDCCYFFFLFPYRLMFV